MSRTTNVTARASTSPSAITNSERSWNVAPATETMPSLPGWWNGIGSGKTYAGRMNTHRTSAWIANAIATLAATHPTVDPRAQVRVDEAV